MGVQKVVVKLSKRDQKALLELIRKKRVTARIHRRIQILQLLHQGKTTGEIHRSIDIAATTVRSVGSRYIEHGLERALYEDSRPGKKRTLSAKQANRIIAMVCSNAPEGLARWSIRLIVRESKKRGIVGSVGRETIRILLKSHDIKPWREKNVVYRRAKRRVHRKDGRSS